MDTAIAEFVAITGADAEQATQLLEASNGNLEVSNKLFKEYFH